MAGHSPDYKRVILAAAALCLQQSPHLTFCVTENERSSEGTRKKSGMSCLKWLQIGELDTITKQDVFVCLLLGGDLHSDFMTLLLIFSCAKGWRLLSLLRAYNAWPDRTKLIHFFQQNIWLCLASGTWHTFSAIWQAIQLMPGSDCTMSGR